jgi:hypothetical protein
MAPGSDELYTLLRVLKERGIALGEDDVAWAFESESNRAQAAAWVQKYLQPSTLLSKDELLFYQKHGIGESSPAVAAAGRPFSDHEFELAIDSLETSTAAIEKQCHMLEQQKRALQKLQSQNASVESIAAAREQRSSKSAREKAALDFDIDELSQSTSNRLRTSIKQVDATTGSLPASVDRILEKDDRLLDGLQKLLPQLTDAPSGKHESVEVEELCSALTTLTVREIQARLDRVYQQSLLEYARRQAPEKPLSDHQVKQRELLRAELKELSGEIEGLVAIAIDNQYRKPLKHGLLSARGDAQSQKFQWAEYTISVLTYLVARLDVLSKHIQKLHAHGAALRSVSRTFEGTLSTEQAHSGAPTPTTPISDRNSKGLKPLRLVQANISETPDPATTFLRENDIRIPDQSSASKLAEVLDSAVNDREDRLARLKNTTEETITDGIAQSLAKTESDLHDLEKALRLHSHYGEVKLVDPSLQAGVDDLEQRTQRLGEEMRELDLEGIIRAVQSAQSKVVEKLSM